MSLMLVEPKIEYTTQIEEYRKEFIANSDSMDGTAKLREHEAVDKWLEYIKKIKSKETCDPNWVPEIQFLCIRESDNRLVGMINIRPEMNDECLKYYGNMGYSIRRSERRKGYAKEQLSLALKLCSQMGMDKVLITCDKENIASSKTIIANGGVLENEIFDPSDNSAVQRYWISI